MRRRALAAPLRAEADDHGDGGDARRQRHRGGIVAAVGLGELGLERCVAGGEDVAGLVDEGGNGGAGRYVLDSEGGVDRPVPIEEYRARIARRLAQEAPTLQDFRDRWVDPEARQELLAALPEGQTGAIKLRLVEGMGDYDLYDVLGSAAYGLDPKSRRARAEAFGYKARNWLDSLPPAASGVLRAVVGQFGGGGTEALENPAIFQLPAVIAAGGVAALHARLGRLVAPRLDRPLQRAEPLSSAFLSLSISIANRPASKRSACGKSR